MGELRLTVALRQICRSFSSCSCPPEQVACTPLCSNAPGSTGRPRKDSAVLVGRFWQDNEPRSCGWKINCQLLQGIRNCSMPSSYQHATNKWHHYECPAPLKVYEGLHLSSARKVREFRPKGVSKLWQRLPGARPLALLALRQNARCAIDQTSQSFCIMSIMLLSHKKARPKNVTFCNEG